MSTLSLAVISGQGVLASPSPVISGPVPITWISEANVSPGEPQPSADTESPILSAVAPTPSPHPLVSIPNAPIDPQPTTQIFTLTVTETLTITVPASSPSSPAAPAAAPPSVSRNTKSPTIKWRNPKKMDDLSAFNISAFAGGKANLEIIQGIPSNIASASASISSTSSSSSSPSLSSPDPDLEPDEPNQSPILLTSNHNPRSRTKWRDSESSIQLFYPAGSINPAQKPVGGAQFYATPLDLTGARNVSLGYGAFFQEGFDWVLGGKMPGLYGGHAGCSGGNAALDCFSTRLMWRRGGQGELYLYAPKDKQTPDLCNDPQSVCDAKYGFSIGRGSFEWEAGKWTNVLQTVTLNTPGKQDGCFTLDVNGVRVLERCDIFYRDVPPKKGEGEDSGGGGGGLGGLLGTLLSDLFRRGSETGSAAPTSTSTSVVQPMYDAQQGLGIQTTPGPTINGGDPEATSTSTSTSLSTADDPQPTPPPPPPDSSVHVQETDDDETLSVESHDAPVGFKGLFFSSFFGGHGARYATPTDQYVWFKDFTISYNNA